MLPTLGQAALLTAQHYATKQAADMYLRGSSRRKPVGVGIVSKPQSLQNQITQLKKRVNANTPRRIYFRSEKAIVGAGSPGYLRTDWSLTSAFIADPQFRNDINGDRWKNHWVKFFYTGDTPSVTQIRLIVYSAKNTGTEFTPTADKVGFCTPLDPSAFTVYHDEMINNPNAINPYHFQRFIRLNMSTLYNGSATPGVLEKGDIRMQVQFANDTTLDGGQGYTQLCVSDT